MKKYDNLETLSHENVNFEVNEDFTLLHLHVFKHPVINDQNEHEQVMIQTMFCADGQSTDGEAVLQVDYLDKPGCGALESCANTIKEMVAPAALTVENSIFKGTFYYENSDYERERFKDPKNIKNPILTRTIWLHFDTQDEARQFLADLVLNNA